MVCPKMRKALAVCQDTGRARPALCKLPFACMLELKTPSQLGFVFARTIRDGKKWSLVAGCATRPRRQATLHVHSRRERS